MTSSPPDVRQESLETLKARLDDPAVAAALSNLLDHADLLAVLLVGLDGLVSRSEVIGDALAEGVDDFRQLAAAFPRPDGVSSGDVVSSLMTVSAVLPRIAEPMARVADSGLIDRVLDSGIIDHLLKHADLLGILLDGLDGFVRRGDTISDNLAESVDELRGLSGSVQKPAIDGAELMSNVVSLVSLLPALTGTLNRVVESRLLDRVLDSGMIDSLLRHADLLEVMLDGVDGFVRRGDTISDSLADGVAEMRGLTASIQKPEGVAGKEVVQNLVSLAPLLPALGQTLSRLVESRLLDRVLESRVIDNVLDSHVVENFLDSGMLAPQTVDQLAMVGRALSNASAHPGEAGDVPGLFGLLRLRKDPEIARALAFAISLSRSLGAELEAASDQASP
jgi:uncharacterized protein YjgD (DUF1641 family)